VKEYYTETEYVSFTKPKKMSAFPFQFILARPTVALPVLPCRPMRLLATLCLSSFNFSQRRKKKKFKTSSLADELEATGSFRLVGVNVMRSTELRPRQGKCLLCCMD
jgi:hypothetical protein